MNIDASNMVIDPNQLRWKPFDIPTEETDFVQGLKTISHAGKYISLHIECYNLYYSALTTIKIERGTSSPNAPLTFLTGHPSVRHGISIHVYTANTSMKDKCFYNSDGDFLIGNSMSVYFHIRTTTPFDFMHSHTLFQCHNKVR